MKIIRRAFVVAVAGTVILCAAHILYSPAFRASDAHAAAQSSNVQYAAISNVTVVEANGKFIGTAWIRYMTNNGVSTTGVNASINPTSDVPKDDAAVRQWVTATNNQEGVSMVSPQITGPEIVSGALAQDQVRREAVARAIAKLGAENYEMVNTEPEVNKPLLSVTPRLGGNGNQANLVSNQPYVLYFKRTP